MKQPIYAVYEAHFGAFAERHKLLEAATFLMENSISFAVHDDRGGTGCFTVTVDGEDVNPKDSDDAKKKKAKRSMLQKMKTRGFTGRKIYAFMAI